MTIVTITKVEATRAGDYITLRDNKGHEWSGVAWDWTWEDRSSALVIGAGDVVRYYTEDKPPYTFVSATREIPDLPTSPGSVIEAEVTRTLVEGTSKTPRTTRLFRLRSDRQDRCWVDPDGLMMGNGDILDWSPISAA